MGFIISYFSSIIPFYAWFGLKGISLYDPGQLIIILLNGFHFLLLISNITLQQAFRENKLCQINYNLYEGKIIESNSINTKEIEVYSGISYGNPSYESLSLSALIFFIILLNLFRHKTIKNSHVFKLLSVLFFVNWGSWYSGDYIFKHIIFGVIIGSVFGIMFSISIFYFWVDHFPFILSLEIFKWIGIKDSFCITSKKLLERCGEDIIYENNKKSIYAVYGINIRDPDELGDNQNIILSNNKNTYFNNNSNSNSNATQFYNCIIRSNKNDLKGNQDIYI